MLRLHCIQLAPAPVAIVVDDEGFSVHVPLAMRHDELLAVVAGAADVPGVDRLSDAEVKVLAEYREAYEISKVKYYEGPSGRAEAQIALQKAMTPLVEREKRGALVDALAAAAGEAAPPTSASYQLNEPPPPGSPAAAAAATVAASEASDNRLNALEAKLDALLNALAPKPSPAPVPEVIKVDVGTGG